MILDISVPNDSSLWAKSLPLKRFRRHLVKKECLASDRALLGDKRQCNEDGVYYYY